MENLKILYDNVALNGFVPDWGFSALVELTDSLILFDTGAKPEVLADNVKNFGVDISKVETVFISHNHWDHVGGLSYVVRENKEFELFIPESDCADFEEELPEGVICVPISAPTYISERAISTGEMPTGMEEPAYEQSMVVNTAKGYVLITGCSHPGIVNIAKRAVEICGEKLRLTVGGFHLYRSSDEAVEKVAEDLKQFTQFVAPCHCTGERGREIFKKLWENRFMEAAAGIEIPLS